MGPSVVFFNINEQLRLTREGLWLSNGAEITHEATVRAFFRFLNQSPDGQWWIKIGHEEKSVLLEDTPTFVQRITGSPEQGYQIHLLHDATDRSEPLRAQTLRYSPGRLVCLTERGWEARFLRAPYYEILQHLKKDAAGYSIEIQGRRIQLQSPDSKP